MAEIDDETLAYAMAMGYDFRLCEMVLRSTERPQLREIELSATTRDLGRQVSRTGYVAQLLIDRLMQERVVTFKKLPGVKEAVEWLVADVEAGLEIRFKAPSEKIVRAGMLEAVPVIVDEEFDSIQVRRAKLSAVQRAKDKEVVETRFAEWSWPPNGGSPAARVLALAKTGQNFWFASMHPKTKRMTDPKPCKPATLFKRLKNPSLAISTFQLHGHDSLKGVEMDLDPAQAYVEISFCLIKDAHGAEVATFEFVASMDDSSPQKG